jgi:hypothetical protein
MIPGGAGYFRHAFCVIVLATALIPHAQANRASQLKSPTILNTLRDTPTWARIE